MKLHLPAGQLTDDAPEVWGHLRFSVDAGIWFIDWYSPTGQLQGATVADAQQYRWAELHLDELTAEWHQIRLWQIACYERLPGRPILDDDIPF
jgi:hypothetical protein